MPRLKCSRTDPLHIFVHVPKTAGTSVRATIANNYGPDQTWFYQEATGGFFAASNTIFSSEQNGRGSTVLKCAKFLPKPVLGAVVGAVEKCSSTGSDAMRRAAAVVGHLSVDAFEDLAESSGRPSNIYTVVRDPLKRMVSHYRYARQHMQLPREIQGWKGNCSPRLPFCAFALSDELRNFQTTYTGKDISTFTDIGTTEHLSSFLGRIGLVESPEDVPVLRTTSPDYKLLAALADNDFRREFREWHSLDYEFYELARQHESEQVNLEPILPH